MPVMIDPVSLSTFESLLVSGQLTRRGAQKNQHEAVVNGPAAPPSVPLPPGGSMARAWNCRKDGLYRRLGLDRWVHLECCVKTSQDRLEVADMLLWHNGKSVAKRSYTAAARGPRSMERQVGPWQIDMKGVTRVLRPAVEGAMRKELPKIDTMLSDILQEVDPAAQRRAG